VADLFATRGPPAGAPGRLASVTRWPGAARVPERQAADAVRRRRAGTDVRGVERTAPGGEPPSRRAGRGRRGAPPATRRRGVGSHGPRTAPCAAVPPPLSPPGRTTTAPVADRHATAALPAALATTGRLPPWPRVAAGAGDAARLAVSPRDAALHRWGGRARWRALARPYRGRFGPPRLGDRGGSPASDLSRRTSTPPVDAGPRPPCYRRHHAQGCARGGPCWPVSLPRPPAGPARSAHPASSAARGADGAAAAPTDAGVSGRAGPPLGERGDALIGPPSLGPAPCARDRAREHAPAAVGPCGCDAPRQEGTVAPRGAPGPHAPDPGSAAATGGG
jgi:hypothetical protein